MAETASTMMPLGTPAPDFQLLDSVSHKLVSLQDLKSEFATVIMFICNHCPYVKLIQHDLVKVANLYQHKGVRFVAISSNDAIRYPQDGPEKMRDEAISNHYPFPYLFDESQQVAKAYHAACTPDIFVFDKNLLCVYRGRFDESTPGNKKPVTGHDLVAALECILNNKPINSHQHPSLGCNIKWRI